MSIFSTILEKIGISKPAAANTAPDKAKIDSTVTDAMAKAEAEAKARVAAQTTASPDAKSPAVSASATPSIAAGPSTPTTTAPNPGSAAPSSAPAPARPAAVPMVDVMSKLEGLSRAHPDLNWKVSIVDLLKLLDIDSSFEARKSLAQELGCSPNLMNDSASMNIWLHKTVLEKIAENGGNIPATLLNK
jgi:hypothetical protein